jgi:UDP-glucose 4-epimerase
MKQRVMVTGGMGYIGSHTVVQLVKSGCEAVIVDDLSNSQIEMLDGIEQICGLRPAFEQFNLCDADKVRHVFEKYQFDAVIHFAAFKAVGESVTEPLKYYRNNLVSLINLLEAMAASGCGSMIFSSSCTVYGQPDSLPVTEQSPVKKALSPYGNTKQICEEILADFTAADSRVKAISLRYFNPIGAHPSGLIGELPLGVPANLVPFITQTAAGVRKELQIFGDDYSTPDGSCIRDYINVVDLADAHIAALQRLAEGKNTARLEFFNIGTGKGVSVFEAVRAFEEATGVQVPRRTVGRRPGDIEQIWADTALANAELGWQAKVSLQDTMRSAWNWERRFRSLDSQ